MVYLDLLGRAARQAACQIHAYVLMTNHIHLLLTPTDELGPAALMKSLGERYVKYVNRRYARTGTLWEGRYRSCLVQSERYLMVCQRYIELNPVRANLVSDPVHYPWSSYRCNAHGEEGGLVTPHELYGRLGHDEASRAGAYRELCRQILTEDTLTQVRRATHRSLAFGNRAFADQMVQLLRPITSAPGSDPKSDLKSDPGSDPGFWCSIADDQK
jgi:putative transposase